MNYKEALKKVIHDPRYKENIKFGKPRPGHPEGTVEKHIAELESNLEQMKDLLWGDEQYWKLKFLIHVHDVCKVDAIRGVPAEDPRSHKTLAKEFAKAFTDDEDLLAIVQYHGESYFLWKQVHATGHYDHAYFMNMLNQIEDWDLFLAFTIIDGNTKGKDLAKLYWFIHEVRKYKETTVDETWVIT